MLYVDKYRPHTFDKFVVNKDIADNLKKLVASGDFPHTLFYGPPGAGKKTLVLALLREIYGPGVEKGPDGDQVAKLMRKARHAADWIHAGVARSMKPTPSLYTSRIMAGAISNDRMTSSGDACGPSTSCTFSPPSRTHVIARCVRLRVLSLKRAYAASMTWFATATSCVATKMSMSAPRPAPCTMIPLGKLPAMTAAPGNMRTSASARSGVSLVTFLTGLRTSTLPLTRLRFVGSASANSQARSKRAFTSTGGRVRLAVVSVSTNTMSRAALALYVTEYHL